MRVIKTRSDIAPRTISIEKQLKQIPRKGYDFFRRITPKDTGNARNKTTLAGDTIRADYPYAVRLDKGYSRQAPAGMSKPTISYMKQLVTKIIGN